MAWKKRSDGWRGEGGVEYTKTWNALFQWFGESSRRGRETERENTSEEMIEVLVKKALVKMEWAQQKNSTRYLDLAYGGVHIGMKPRHHQPAQQHKRFFRI